jgi:hypothetical protein
MKFHTVNTITNGVLPTEANKGQKVEWDASLVDFETGEVHRTFKASGVIDGFTYMEMNGHSWKYVIFIDGRIDGKDVIEMGVPVGFFR